MFYFSISLHFCYMSILYELLYNFYCTSSSILFLQRKVSSGPMVPIIEFSRNRIYSLFLTPFDGKCTNITFILSILKSKVLNLVVLMIQDNSLLDVGKAFS